MSLDDGYIKLTDPNPYHQVIVVSQKVINNGFKNMWNLAKMNPDPSPLKHFKQSSHGESLESDIGIPSVRLQVTSTDPMLYFMLSLKEGKLILFKSEDGDDTFQWDIKDWTFAFSVAISHKKIEEGTAEYNEFQQRSGLPNSVFSLAQLFIDTSSSTKWDKKHSDFGDKTEAYKNLPAAAKGSFATFVGKWLHAMEAGGCNILGYLAQAKNDELNKYAPTFPPTSIDYHCYPWRGPKGNDREEDGVDKNALCYLMMTNNKSNPSQVGLPYTTAWVDDQDHGATFCMNRSLFWPWMQEIIRDVIIGMVPFPDKPSVEWNDIDHNLPFGSSINTHVGDLNPSKNEYTWVTNWQPGKLKWNLDCPERQSKNKAYNPRKQSDWMELIETATTRGWLEVNEGSEMIKIGGGSDFVFTANHDTHTYTRMKFPISWSMEMNMTAVEGGGLVFKPALGSSKITVTHEVEGNMKWGQKPEEIAKEWEEMMQKGMVDSLKSVQDKLFYGLAHQNRLFLPAKGSFLMKDPKFNSLGDLMVHLDYNGADPPPIKDDHFNSLGA